MCSETASPSWSWNPEYAAYESAAESAKGKPTTTEACKITRRLHRQVERDNDMHVAQHVGAIWNTIGVNRKEEYS